MGYTKKDILTKHVFFISLNNKREQLVLLSTDSSLLDKEIVRRYGNRWSIELKKLAKILVKLDIEFQGRSYDMLISNLTIVFAYCILFELLRRQVKAHETFANFFMYCNDIQDMDFKIIL